MRIEDAVRFFKGILGIYSRNELEVDQIGKSQSLWINLIKTDVFISLSIIFLDLEKFNR